MVHFTLQGKGGVGKSYVSSLIAQYLIESGKRVICIDTDPVNATLKQYKLLDTIHLGILNGSKINDRNFDKLMEILLETEEDTHVVIDNGASSFIPLSNYLIENMAIEMLHDYGRDVVVHPVITGGQALADTLNGFNTLAKQFSRLARIVIWLNEYFGLVKDGSKDFKDMAAYKNNEDRVYSIIRIPQLSEDTFGKDVELMLNHKLTFEEALNNGMFNIMSKRRLEMIKKNLWNQMSVIDELIAEVS